MSISEPILEQLLGLPHLTITGYELPNAATVILDIKPTLKAALRPDCGHPSADVHDYDDPRLIRDLSLWGRHCFLRLCGRRFDCAHCGHPFTERLEWVDFNSSHTRRYESYVFELCRKNTPHAKRVTPISASPKIGSQFGKNYMLGHARSFCQFSEPEGNWCVSQLEDLGYDAVEGIFLRLGKKTVEQRQPRCVRVISLDEIALKKGHNDFVLVIGAPEESCCQLSVQVSF